MKHGFKVVCRENRKLMSFAGISAVRYITGKPTHPRYGNGPLAVFKTLKDAKEFIEGRGDDVTLYPCLYRPSRSRELWYMDNFIKVRRFDGLPHGTDFASEVTITRD